MENLTDDDVIEMYDVIFNANYANGDFNKLKAHQVLYLWDKDINGVIGLRLRYEQIMKSKRRKNIINDII